MLKNEIILMAKGFSKINDCGFLKYKWIKNVERNI